MTPYKKLFKEIGPEKYIGLISSKQLLTMQREYPGLYTEVEDLESPIEITKFSDMFDGYDFISANEEDKVTIDTQNEELYNEVKEFISKVMRK
jgi:hypothetical protein